MSIIRKTKTVKLILEQFNQNEEAISVVELVNKFKNKMDKTTVYRILDRLEDSEMLHSFIDNDGLKRYAKGHNHILSSSHVNIHPHFLCEECGTSSCLPIEITIPNIPDYTIKSSEHLLIGQCKDCIN